MTDIIRTKRNGCWQVRSNTWGAFLQPVDDPLAEATLEPGALERFELNEDITRVPATLWSRWVKLCFHFAHLKQGDLEVSCRLLRQEHDRSQWRILVPRQEVSGASVRIDSFDDAIDIETGELIASYPPDGWIPAGSSHSHNSMTLNRFSSVDDASELGCPGLHVVLSHINVAKRTYVCTASVTANHRRFYLEDASAVIDLTATDDTFHPKVLKVVKPERIGRLGGWWPMPPPQLQQQASRSLTPLPADHAQPALSLNQAASAAAEKSDSSWRNIASDIEDTLRSAYAELNHDEFTDLLLELEEIIDELRYSSSGFHSSWDFDHDTSDSTQDGASGAAPPTAIRLLDGEW